VDEHQPVLVAEALAGLAVVGDGCYVDGTYGRGGHSSEILARLGPDGRLLAIDKDPQAVADGRRRFAGDARFTIEHAGFECLREVVEHALGPRKVAGVLLDLGVSSPQLDDAARGFSFAADGPLDMRMNPNAGRSAADWLAGVDERELAQVLREYGEEPRAAQIAAAIVRERAMRPIRTTRQLAELVRPQSGKRRIHPATRVFQAIRIAINDELGALAAALAQAVAVLAAGGRLVVISFHSLEDRIVKRFMLAESRGDPVYAGLPEVPPEARPRLKRIGGLVRPGATELAANPRARSARLRVAERVPEHAA
jgi:16S rRNA (cytosine1402-N4)-methyltransferase